MQEVAEYIKRCGVCMCDLSMEEVLQLINTLVYDGQIESLLPGKLARLCGATRRVRAVCE